MHIIPQPVSVELLKGEFALDNQVFLEVVTTRAEVNGIAEKLAGKIRSASSFVLNIVEGESAEAGSKLVILKLDESLGKLGEDTTANQDQWNLPCVIFDDYPRFGWRGQLLDVSRPLSANPLFRFFRAGNKTYIPIHRRRDPG